MIKVKLQIQWIAKEINTEKNERSPRSQVISAYIWTWEVRPDVTETNINLRKEFQEWKEMLAEGKYKKSQNDDWKVLFFDLHLSITIGIYNADTLCACTCMHVCKCVRASTHTHTCKNLDLGLKFISQRKCWKLHCKIKIRSNFPHIFRKLSQKKSTSEEVSTNSWICT